MMMIRPRRVAAYLNPSLQPTCYGWHRQPAQAAELKRWADQRSRQC